MSIAFVDETSSGFLNSTTNNLSVTVGSGANRLLTVNIYASGDFVTGVTYNGDAATLVAKVVGLGAAAGQYTYLYYLVAPDTGTANVTVSSSSNLGGFITACEYTGVLQSGPLGDSDVSNTAGATSISVTLTTTEDNSWIMGYSYMGSDVETGTNATLRGGSNAVIQAFDSNAALTPAGNFTATTNQDPSAFASMIAAAFAPHVDANPGVFRRRMQLVK